MTTPESPQQNHPQSPATPITMTVSGSGELAHRRFTQADVGFIDALLREGPFDQVQWTVEDQQGTTEGEELAPVLRNVLWHSIRSFSVVCSQAFHTPIGLVDRSKPMNYLALRLGTSIELDWSAGPDNRQPVELTYHRLIHFLDQLPINRGYSSRFTDTPEPEPEPQPEPHWWSPIRAPRSIIDWVAVAVIATFAVSAAGTIVLLIAKVF